MLALGVDLKTVYEDYLLSAQYIPQKYLDLLEKLKDYHLNEELVLMLADVLTVKKDYLDAFFSTMNEKWGNLENFFASGLKIKTDDRKKLRERYLD